MEDQQGRVEKIVKFTWTIKNFSKLNCQKLYSETFFTGCHPWRIVTYPKGNKADGLSIFLAVGDTANFPAGWSISTNFKLSLINQVDDNMTRTYGTQILFHAKRVTIGYRFVIKSVEFSDPNKGFLVNDTCIIVAEVSVENSGYEDFVQLLVEACSKHPTLIESQRKRNRSPKFTEWSFTALGRVLHFLKTKKVKDMNDDACKELQNLWEELETFGFDDLTWLEHYVQSALGMKNYMERAEQVEKLKENVADLEVEMKNLKVKMAASEVDLEIARKELAKAEEGFVKRDLDDELGYGIP